MSKRMLRTLGAGLMAGGEQYWLNRRAKLEEEREANLMSIAEGRLDISNRQLGLMETGQKTTAEHQQRMQEGQLLEATENRAFRSQSLAYDQANQSAMNTYRTAAADAQTAYYEMQAKISQGTRSDVQKTRELKQLDKFISEQIPATLNSYLDVKDLEKATLRRHAMTVAIESGTLALAKPEQFDAYIANLEKNLGAAGVDVTKLDKKSFISALRELRTKRDLLAPTIDNAQLEVLVLGRLRAPVPNTPVTPEPEPPSREFGREFGLMSGEGLREAGTAMFGSGEGSIPYLEGTDPYGIHTVMKGWDTFVQKPWERLMYGTDSLKPQE